MAGFEWDPRKEQSNLRKHHFDFTTATLIWAGPVVEMIAGNMERPESSPLVRRADVSLS
jgi:uncharacterized DUF497 family protein